VKEFLLGTLASILASEIVGSCPAISRWLVRRAVGFLPKESRERYAEEWNAELDVLRKSDRNVSTLLWAIRVVAGAPRIGKTLRSSAKARSYVSPMMLLYQMVMGVALLISIPLLLLRRGSNYLAMLQGRLGKAAGAVRFTGGIWLHAVSVSEVGVAAALARGLPADVPLLITTVTPTGQARAHAMFKPERRAVEIAYLPFDLGFAVRRFYNRFAPRALVMVGGDYWPLLQREARRRGLPVASINCRIGDQSLARMRRLRPIVGELLAGIDRFGVQTQEDYARFISLGVAPERIRVTGNIEYESPEAFQNPELEKTLCALAAGRPILLAGSTVAGEEEKILAAHEMVGGGARALLILAPRHPERWTEVEALLRGRTVAAVRRSALPATGIQVPAVVLLDSLGELASLYRLATAAFIGGTLVPTGGHNPLEAARSGVPVAVGPSMHNFRRVAEQFDRARAWRRVCNARELGEVWKEWLKNPAAARDQGARAVCLIDESRGALQRTLDILEGLQLADQGLFRSSAAF
jgi:3-deoxy-D-manno-octulosonic-acid transferase